MTMQKCIAHEACTIAEDVACITECGEKKCRLNYMRK